MTDTTDALLGTTAGLLALGVTLHMAGKVLGKSKDSFFLVSGKGKKKPGSFW